MTSVPPTQPPAAPETDVRLTEAEREAVNVAVDEAETCVCCGDDYGSTHVYGAVERIVAERVRVVEGERDAVVEVGAYAQQKEATARAVNNAARMAQVAARRTRELAAMTARAESAEAAHRALQAAVEALAAEWDRYGPMAPEAHQILDDLRALAGGEER